MGVYVSVCVRARTRVCLQETQMTVAEGVAQIPLSFAQHHGGSVVEEGWGVHLRGLAPVCGVWR